MVLTILEVYEERVWMVSTIREVCEGRRREVTRTAAAE